MTALLNVLGVLALIALALCGIAYAAFFWRD
jgi:nitrogen fixation-related uncharacterized protein